MTTILTTEKLQEITAIAKSLGDNTELLSSYIEVSEEMHLRNGCLGVALYDDIISQIENNTLSGITQTLVEKYLYQLSAWYSYLEASPFIIYKANAKGFTKQFSENSQSLDREEFATVRQSISEKATFWRGVTVAYLDKNKASFPLWRDTEANPIDSTFDSSNGIYL